MKVGTFYNLLTCPYKDCKASHCRPDASPASFCAFGSYYRKSDSKKIQRFKCLLCRKTFSRASFAEEFAQKKRQHNSTLSHLLTKGVSQRGCAMILALSRKTVARKLLFLGMQAKRRHKKFTQKLLQEEGLAQEYVFDEMESFIHTKLKPVSIPLLVHKKTRYILDIDVCVMPAKGKLAGLSVKKYKKRPNHRLHCAKRVLARSAKLIAPRKCDLFRQKSFLS